MAGSDDKVVVDLSARLDTGEALTNVVCQLWQLRAFGETVDVDKTATMLSGAVEVSGSTVLQRVINLERGRYYRLEILYGAAGNRRGSGLLIHCEE